MLNTFSWSSLMAWFSQNQVIVFWLTVSSFIYLLIMVILTPLVVAFIPYDYFKEEYAKNEKFRLWLIWWHILKNCIGVILLLAGLLMLILPGQGVLTILLALMFLDFPRKKKLERWIISKRPIFNTINKIRSKFSKRPLEL